MAASRVGAGESCGLMEKMNPSVSLAPGADVTSTTWGARWERSQKVCRAGEDEKG